MPDNTIGGEATTETVRITGHQGDEIEAYLAYPPGPGPFAGVVVLHHMPGYDEATKQITEIFAANGYTAILPNLHWREALGASPDDAAAAVRAAGGVPDERLVGDVDGAARFLRSLPTASGKVGVIGYCSRVAVELDEQSARSLAGAILSALDTVSPGHAVVADRR
jgi:carboxymethylenebutenolidase